MPYHIEQSGVGWVVVSDSGKRRSKRPLPKKRAQAQLRALYANDPHAKRKDAGCTCATTKGERIAPGITRIRGNLCNVHGRYGPCDAAQGARATIDRNKRINAARAGQGGGKGRKPRAPRKTEAQRAAEQEEKKRQRDAEREAKRQEQDAARRAERDRLLNESGLSNQLRDALVDAAAGDNLAPQNGAELVKLGLAEQGEDGSYRLSPKGRQVVNAADRGDAGMLRDAMGEARDQVARDRQRTDERTRRQQEREAKRAEAERRRQERESQRRGGGGSGKREPKKEEPKPQVPRRPAPRRSAGRGSSSPSAGSSAGNISRRVEARRRREDQAKREQQRQAERAQAEQRRQQDQAERSRVTTPALANTARTLSEGGRVSERDAEALIRNGLARRDRDGMLVLTTTGLRAVRQKEAPLLRRPSQPVQTAPRGGDCGKDSIPASFTVFKDARGQWRWITRTTTAFEDRDGEVISIKALEKAVERMDTRGNHGPLRWWHVGEPEPHNHEAPWGKGADLGWCDFSAVHGRTLIESGTFINEEIARAVAAKADSLELSPGFLHNRFTDPDAENVYNDIDMFERSTVPTWAGRASNFFTGLTVEELSMDQKKKEAFDQLGVSPETAAAVLGNAEAKEKDAEQAGIRYKETDPILAALKAFIGATVKEALAEPPAPAEEPPATEEPAAATKDDGEGDMEVAAEEPAVEEQAADDLEMDEDVGGLTLSPEDITAIGEAVAAAIQGALAPLVGAMDMETKMRGHLDEIKGLFGSYTTTKDAEAAQTRAKVESIDQRLKELEGDQPEVRPSTRASRDPNTIINDAALLAAAKASTNGAGPFDDIITNLGLGPQN